MKKETTSILTFFTYLHTYITLFTLLAGNSMKLFRQMIPGKEIASLKFSVLISSERKASAKKSRRFDFSEVIFK